MLYWQIWHTAQTVCAIPWVFCFSRPASLCGKPVAPICTGQQQNIAIMCGSPLPDIWPGHTRTEVLPFVQRLTSKFPPRINTGFPIPPTDRPDAREAGQDLSCGLAPYRTSPSRKASRSPAWQAPRNPPSPGSRSTGEQSSFLRNPLWNKRTAPISVYDQSASPQPAQFTKSAPHEPNQAGAHPKPRLGKLPAFPFVNLYPTFISCSKQPSRVRLIPVCFTHCLSPYLL